ESIEEPSEALQMLGNRLRLRYAPHWTPVAPPSPPPRIAWTPARSERVTPAERRLARIVHHLHEGLNCVEIARKTGIPLRTVQRKVRYLLSFENDVGENGAVQ